MRVAELDMTNNSIYSVISGSTLIPTYVHVKGTPILEDARQLHSTQGNIHYSKVCRKIKAYLFGSIYYRC